MSQDERMREAVEEVPVSRAWPVLAAFAGVVMLVAATIAVDLVVAQRTAQRTRDMVGNALRSIELVDDMSEQADRLSHHVPDERDALARIARDAVAYDPLANYGEERERWVHLQELLKRVERAPDDRALHEQIGAVGDELVAINRRQATAQERAIARVHRNAILADASVGGLTIVLAVVLVALALRVLRHQRQLTERYIALLSERNRELDAFAARAAHDLRGPLNPVKGYAQMLSTGKEPPEEVKQMAERIGLAVTRMNRVIDDMLELSRAGRPADGRAVPSKVATDVLAELGPEVAGVEFRLALTDEPVACAAGVLTQVLRNLIGNALKFRSRQRPLMIDLTAQRENGHIAISVGDNGVGMDAESAAHAFEPFYRGNQHRETPGHGLGLAIVERTVRSLGGSCTLSSTPDRGTHIVVRLPRAL
jgi:signal transduction histidine kinase